MLSAIAHVFITRGTTARAARFNPDHVLEYLFIKDYTQVHKDAIYRQKYQKMGGEFQVGGKPYIELRKRKKGLLTKKAAKEWEEAKREAYLNPPDPNVLTSLKPCVSKYLRFCEKQKEVNVISFKKAENKKGK